MTTVQKVLFSVSALFVGTIVFGVVRDTLGSGQHIVSGLLIALLIYIWTR